MNMLTSKGTIRSGHAVREAFSGHSTGNDQGCYYTSKGQAVNAFDMELQTFDLYLDRDDLDDFHGDMGRKVIDVYSEVGNCVGLAVLSWYRTETGRYEFIGYLA